MKKITTLLLVLFVGASTALLAAKIDTSSIDMIFDSIGKPRSGLDQTQIKALKSPFSVVRAPSADANSTSIGGSVYVLRAVLGNIVKINKSWYKLGDKIDTYTITDISSNGVVISNGSEKLDLKFTEGNSNVNITIK